MQALESYTLDSESYQQLICYLDTLTPFEAIRQAEEINKMNGFEVVSRVEVGKWKKSVKAKRKFQNGNSLKQNENIKNAYFQKDKYEIEFDFFVSENENIKIQKVDTTPLNESNFEKGSAKSGTNCTRVLQYQKDYMKLLSC